MTFSEEYKATCSDVIGELTRVLDSIDPAQLERLKDAILAADQVFFVGVGQCCKEVARLPIIIFIIVDSVVKRSKFCRN